ncbi:MAG: hypothetical protein QMD46_01540 [Methanomicrobiales archaeon]|nr:hypothetical protein [Methanomicrobiales archaeon]
MSANPVRDPRGPRGAPATPWQAQLAVAGMATPIARKVQPHRQASPFGRWAVSCQRIAPGSLVRPENARAFSRG